MNLIRQLEIEHKKIWKNLLPLSPEMEVARDCHPEWLSGWEDPDISLWDVSAVDGKPTLEDILVALCRHMNNKEWDKISYLQFPEEAVSSAGLILTPSNGNTGDNRVDSSKTHFEIKAITGKQLCSLLFEISRSEFKIEVFTKTQFNTIVLAIYDRFSRVRKDQVVQSATAQETSISSPPTGTVSQEAMNVETSEQRIVYTNTTTTKQSPKLNSSDTSV